MFYHKIISRLVSFLMVTAAFQFASCSSDSVSQNVGEATVYSFTFYANDSIEGLENVKFSIDQLNGRIFNADSLPYKSDVTKLLPSMSFYHVPSSYSFDGERWNGTDSLDFTKPKTLEVVSYDGKTAKTYTVTVNVHQTDPNAIVWKNINATYSPAFNISIDNKRTVAFGDKLLMYGFQAYDPKLYISTDKGSNWTETSVSGLSHGTNFKTLIVAGNNLYVQHDEEKAVYTSANGAEWAKIDMSTLQGTYVGLVGEIAGSAIGMYRNAGNYLRFFTTKDFSTYRYGTQNVPNGFPLRDQATTNYKTRTGVSTIVTGLGFGLLYQTQSEAFVYDGPYTDTRWTNMLWASTDGLNWAQTTFQKPTEGMTPLEFLPLLDLETPLGLRRNASLFYNDGVLFATGGLKYLTDECVKDIHYSRDGGITWNKVDTDQYFPTEFVARMLASIIVDNNNNISIYGGSRIDRSLSDCWRGRINRLSQGE